MFCLTPLLDEYGFLLVSGTDNHDFLQGQLSCNMREIQTHQSRLAAHCNPKGRIVALFRVIKVLEDYLLMLPKTMLTIAQQHLEKYARFSKVNISNLVVEATADPFAVSGLYYQPATTTTTQHEPFNKAWQTLAAKTALALPPLLSAIDHCQWHDHDYAFIRVASHESIRYLIIGSNSKLQYLQQVLNQHTDAININHWRQQDILAGLANIYPETSGQFTPHDINLPTLHGVSFTKGCYIGQEIIARMEHLGHLKRHLYHAQFSSPTAYPPGQTIFAVDNTLNSSNSSPKPIGNLIDSVAIDATHHQALVVLADDAVKNSMQLQINSAPAVKLRNINRI